MNVDPDCLFCSIAAGSIPADVVHADDAFVVFRDIDAQAPVHLLAIPRDHFPDAAALAAADEALAGRLLATAAQAAETAGLTGYRIVLNTGAEGGQTVSHVHAHVLGGRQMQWPPG